MLCFLCQWRIITFTYLKKSRRTRKRFNHVAGSAYNACLVDVSPVFILPLTKKKKDYPLKL